MKKFLIGCLGVFVLVAAVGGFFAYRYVLRPVMGVVQNAEEFAEIAELDKNIRNTSPFSVPADGIITQAQLDRFLGVQASMKAQLSERFDEITRTYEQIDAQGRDPNIRELLTTYSDLLKLVSEAKRAQVSALNEFDFSLAEYSWVKREAIRATGLLFSYVDLTQLTQEQSAQLPDITESVPEANIQLLAPYKETIEETFPLAFFGL